MALELYQYSTSFMKKIFSKDFDGNFVKKARKYQHILLFLLRDTYNYQKITEIQHSVLEQASELMISKNEQTNGNINRSEILKNQNHQFNKYLRELEEWGLVISKETISSKGQKPTKEYCLSRFGKTFAMMIQTMISNDKESTYNVLFDDWRTYLMEFPTAVDTFCLLYLTKCRNYNIFDKFVGYFIDNMIYRNLNIRSNVDLFTQILSITFHDFEKNRILYKLWKESFDELVNETKNLFLYHLKIHLTRLTMKKVKHFGEFEEQIYRNRFGIESIVIEASCICKKTCHYVPVHTLSFVKNLLEGYDDKVIELLEKLDCNYCESKKFEIAPIL